MATSTITNSATSSTAGSYSVPNTGKVWELIEIAVTTDTFIHYTTTATTTNGEFWPAGMTKVKKCLTNSTISYIRSTADGRITFGTQV